jgi:hypothetical protein
MKCRRTQICFRPVVELSYELYHQGAKFYRCLGVTTLANLFIGNDFRLVSLECYKFHFLTQQTIVVFITTFLLADQRTVGEGGSTWLAPCRTNCSDHDWRHVIRTVVIVSVWLSFIILNKWTITSLIFFFMVTKLNFDSSKNRKLKTRGGSFFHLPPFGNLVSQAVFETQAE